MLFAEKRDVEALLSATPPGLAEQLNAVREQGFATQTGELRPDSACVPVLAECADRLRPLLA
jgi:DNA-binding IclR family transcriptional regulator